MLHIRDSFKFYPESMVQKSKEHNNLNISLVRQEGSLTNLDIKPFELRFSSEHFYLFSWYFETLVELSIYLHFRNEMHWNKINISKHFKTVSGNE